MGTFSMQLISKKVFSMKKRNSIYLFVNACVLLLCATTLITAQEAEHARVAQIKLLARASKDSIVLRWAPTTAGGWRIANAIGYTVERMSIDKQTGIEITKYQLLIERPLKPMALEEWKHYAGHSNDFSAIAAQAVYGKLFKPQAGKQGGFAELRAAADELLNRHSFALFAADNDAVTANALGLRFVDKQIRSGERYVYRVYVAKPTTEYTFDTAYVMIDAIDTPPADPPLGFRFESGDGIIKLYWDELDVQHFSGYYVYRSNDGKNYTRLNSTTLIIPTTTQDDVNTYPKFVDTATTNYKKYTYRLVGITPFAEISRPAEIVAFSRDLTAPPAPTLQKPKQLSVTRIKLTWEQSQLPADLKGFVVARSYSPTEEYEILTKQPLPSRQREYTDVLDEYDAAYYAVAAIDTAGNHAFSLPTYIAIVDSVPPPMPKGLRGKVEKNGIVTLWWQPVKKRNILGYRVLRANNPTHDFTQVTGHIHPDTLFVDSVDIRVLTKKIYYKVATVDKHYQHSALSEMVALQKPDVLPPSTPVFRDVFVTDSTVRLSWNLSASSDVAKQLLLRREENSTRWITLDTLTAKKTEYIDKRVKQNIRYLYSLVCIDSAGLRSEETLPVTARPFDSGQREPATNLVANYNRKTKTVILTWNYSPKKKENFWFVIYKSTDGKSFREYESVKAGMRSFTDLTPLKGKNIYGIVVVTAGGGQSEMANTFVNVQ